MPQHEDLRDPLSLILKEDPNSYWLAYQLLHKLEQRFPTVFANLEARYGKGYGDGGGHYYRADSAIAICLRSWPECVDTLMLRGNGLQIGNIKASGEQMGIYRWIGPV